MANHFRSSEGQDGTEAQQKPQASAPYVPQVVPAASQDAQSGHVSPQPAAQGAPASQGAHPQVSVPPVTPAPQQGQPQGTGSIPQVTTTRPSASGKVAGRAPQPTAARPAAAQAAPSPQPAANQAGSTDASFDPSTEAGFTTAFAPITKQADTSRVNNGGAPVISFQGVSMIYPAQPNKPALDNVDVDVYAGEFVFLVGHSGSGKSTFLKLITRELKPTHGKIMVAGQDLGAMRNWKVPYLRRQIGCVFQDFKLLPDKTIFDNVAFALECIGKPRSVIKAQVPEVLRLVGLGEKMDVYPDQLSGGEQQRVSVARAMVNRPPLLVCDEPTGNLDPAISLGIMKLLERINRTGTTVLMATHDREMVDSMRKRVIALEAGHVVRDQEKGGYGYYGAI